MGKPVGITACALELGMSRRSLERHLDAGAPQYRRGHRGRGGQALLDPDAIGAWIAQRDGRANGEELIRLFTADVPAIVAAAIARQFASIDGPHKKAIGPELQRLWSEICIELLERARRDAPDLPDVNHVPYDIVQITQSCRI